MGSWHLPVLCLHAYTIKLPFPHDGEALTAVSLPILEASAGYSGCSSTLSQAFIHDNILYTIQAFLWSLRDARD